MKKIITLIGVLVALCAGTLGAQTSASKASFNREFKDASRENWEKVTDKISLVRFSHESKSSIAYFKNSGELLMSGKLIELSESPEAVQAGIDALAKSVLKRDGALRVTQVFELTEQGATKYYVNMGNEKVYIAVLANSKGKTSIIKRSKLDPNKNQEPVIAAK